MLYIKYYSNVTDPKNGFKARVSLGELFQNYLINLLNYKLTECRVKYLNSFFNFFDSIHFPERCGGVLRSPKGIITSPGYPDSYPSDTECRWEIETEYWFKLVVNVLDLKLPLKSDAQPRSSIRPYEFAGSSSAIYRFSPSKSDKKDCPFINSKMVLSLDLTLHK